MGRQQRGCPGGQFIARHPRLRVLPNEVQVDIEHLQGELARWVDGVCQVSSCRWHRARRC